MSRVSTGEGIKYGFSLLGYLVGVSFVAFVVMAIGAGMAGGSVENGEFGGAFLGGLVVLVGVLIFYAGFIGTVYKVIVDGVSTALERTEPVPGDGAVPGPEPRRGAVNPAPQEPPRDAPVGTAPQGEPGRKPRAESEYPAEERRVGDRPPRNEATGGADRPHRSAEPDGNAPVAEPASTADSAAEAEPLGASEPSPDPGAEPVDDGPGSTEESGPSASRSTGESEMACPECGASNRGQLDSCWKCGTDLTGN